LNEICQIRQMLILLNANIPIWNCFW